MLKVYSAPKELVKPEFKPNQDWKEHSRLEQVYENQIVEYAKKHGKDKEAGSHVSFPHADGYARYVVFSMKPCSLIHLDTGDAWNYPYIERLTAKDILQQIDRDTKLKAMFS